MRRGIHKQASFDISLQGHMTFYCCIFQCCFILSHLKTILRIFPIAASLSKWQHRSGDYSKEGPAERGGLGF